MPITTPATEPASRAPRSGPPAGEFASNCAHQGIDAEVAEHFKQALGRRRGTGREALLGQHRHPQQQQQPALDRSRSAPLASAAPEHPEQAAGPEPAGHARPGSGTAGRPSRCEPAAEEAATAVTTNRLGRSQARPASAQPGNRRGDRARWRWEWRGWSAGRHQTGWGNRCGGAGSGGLTAAR